MRLAFPNQTKYSLSLSGETLSFWPPLSSTGANISVSLMMMTQLLSFVYFADAETKVDHVHNCSTKSCQRAGRWGFYGEE
jgi:hypothetical protein